MPQVSRYVLRKDVEKRMFKVFEKTISDIRKASDVKSFINDLLTPTEKIMLAKRLGIAVLLSKGYDYRSISKVLKVSTTTILAIVKQAAINGQGYKIAVNNILRDEDREAVFLKLEHALGKFIQGHPAGKARADAYYHLRQEKIAHQEI